MTGPPPNYNPQWAGSQYAGHRPADQQQPNIQTPGGQSQPNIPMPRPPNIPMPGMQLPGMNQQTFPQQPAQFAPAMSAPHQANAPHIPHQVPRQQLSPNYMPQPQMPQHGIPPQPTMNHMHEPVSHIDLGPRFGTISSAQPMPSTGLLGTAPDVNIFRMAPTSPVNPPLCTDFIRSSLSKVPKTQAMLSKVKVPLGVTVTPYPKNSQVAVPLINGVIVRCRRCRSYLNPYVEQVEQGARWRCNLCMLINEYPPSFDLDPATQQYTDRSQRAELNVPVYEFIAPVEYMVRDPQPPSFVFVIDVSFLAISSGMTATASKVILECLDRLPNETGLSRMALIAVDSSVHFFNIGHSVTEPQSMVVPDLKDIVIPYRVSDLLVSISECRANLEAILTKLPSLFNSTQKPTVAFGSALNAACNLIAPIGGKVIGLLSTLPTLGEGSLQQREDSKLYGTPRESSMLQPATNFYKMLATEATKNQVAVDLFLFPSAYMDVCSVSCISKYTGGQIQMYPGFNAAKAEDAVKFAADFSNYLQSEFGMEAVLRIRATQGISIPTYHGSFFFRSSDLLALPNVPRDYSYTAQLSIDESLSVQTVGIQAAFLHTTCNGERRIRVINAAFPVSDDPRELVQWIDTGATVDVMSKMAIDKMLNGKIEDGKDYLLSKLCEILTFYKLANGIGQNQQLQLCDSLRSLPLLVLGAMKSFALRSTANVPVDIRSFFMHVIKCGSVSDNVYLFAPYLIPIHLLPESAGLPDPDTGKINLPPSLNLGSDRIERNGMYLLDDGRELVFYIGAGANADSCVQLFGQPYHQLNGGKVLLPRPDGPLASRIGNIISKLALIHRNTPYVYLVKEDSEPGLRAVFFSRLIEDRGASDALPSYQQFLTTVRDKSNS